MGTPLAVQGCTFSTTVSASDGTLSGGSVTVTSQPSQDIAVNGKGMWFDRIGVAVNGLVITALSPPPGAVSAMSTAQLPATADIRGTADDIREGDADTGKKAVLKGDSVTVSVAFVFTTGSYPYTATKSFDVTVKVDDPGQTDVEAS